MTKSGPIETYVAVLRRHVPGRMRKRRRVVDGISMQLRERADRHLWAALSHGDDISFEEAERHAVLEMGRAKPGATTSGSGAWPRDRRTG